MGFGRFIRVFGRGADGLAVGITWDSFASGGPPFYVSRFYDYSFFLHLISPVSNTGRAWAY